jgi:hypothetical protein
MFQEIIHFIIADLKASNPIYFILVPVCGVSCLFGCRMRGRVFGAEGGVDGEGWGKR